jgi:acetyl esterase/lipase/hemerythrin-like domain-containing protein
MKDLQLVLTSDDSRWSLPEPLIAIADEHKYSSRLLDMIEDEAALLAEGKTADLDCIADVLNYIIHYPDRYHHPKEELIFDRMVDADDNTQKVIKRLRQGHEEVATMGHDIALEVEACRSTRSKKKRQTLSRHLDVYINGLREHMHMEETQVFKPAMELLSAADWASIDKQIKPIIDPVFGEQTADRYEQLFSRYLNRFVTVSTGAISPAFVEKAASNIEQLIYAIGEVRQLPGRLADNAMYNGRSQMGLLKQLLSSSDLDEFKLSTKTFFAGFKENSGGVWELVRDAFNAREPELLDTRRAEISEAVSLKDEEDFNNFGEQARTKHQAGKISWQAVATNVLFRLTIKQLMGHAGLGAAEYSKKMTFLTDKVPPGIEVEAVEFEAFKARWLRPEGQLATNKTILYLPGGGFIFPASSGHATIVSKLAKKTRSQGLMVHYRLAPEHPFPAGLEDAVAAYRYLLEDQGIAPTDIVLAGDSAGGGLSMSLLLALQEEGLPLPKAVTLISPLADLSFSGESREFNRWQDPMLPTSRKMDSFDMYSGGTPSKSPLLSPVFGDLSGMPPIFAQVSNTEILLDDTLRLARKARSQGVDAQVEVWNSLPHVWHLWSYLPESEYALSRIADFFNKHFEEQPLPMTGNGI